MWGVDSGSPCEQNLSKGSVSNARMTHNITYALDRLYRAYDAGRSLALLFDYDGTLVPIVQHPRLAVLAPEMRDVLQTMANRNRVSVGVLSGRSIDDLKSMVDIPGLSYVGTCGLECELFGQRKTHGDSPECVDLLEQVAVCLNKTSLAFEGAWLEKKPLGLTWHYRGVAGADVSDARDLAFSRIIQFGDGIRVIDGPMSLEITPNLEWSKGTGVAWLISQLGADLMTMYAGDHANDKEAFEVVRDIGGVTIGVGPDCPPAAEHRVLDPTQLAVFLKRLSHFLSKAR